MGKKTAQKTVNPSSASQDEDNQNKSPEPYTCSGNLQADYTELCQRSGMTVIPPINMRPKPPSSPAQPDAVKPDKGKDKGKLLQVEQEPDLDHTDDGDGADSPPKTYTTKDKFEYFLPCIQVEMENTDKPDTVTEIFIRGWKIDVTMMNIFKQCWPTIEKLHSVNLWNTALNGETLSIMAAFLPQCASLRNLVLDSNPVREQNWHELLTEECPVQNLSLRHCGITDKGAEMLGHSLGSARKTNTKLIALNLSGNQIGDAGMEHIANGLRMNRSLLSLSLANNHIGNKGAQKIGEVLSRFPLTHEEVVERRRQISDKGSPDRNKSPPPSRRADSKDRPGSVRSSSHAEKEKKREKPSAKKKDSKAKDPKEEEKHDKTKGKNQKDEKNATKGKATASSGGGRSSGASIAADAKSGKSKGSKGKDKGKTTQQEAEFSDSTEMVNPLLEGTDFIDGQVWVSGNRMLINLNLSRNRIEQTGMEALLKAMQYQTTLAMDSKSSGTGLLRLCVFKNLLRRESRPRYICCEDEETRPDHSIHMSIDAF
ncbi:hypothetical protein ScPMuIL_002350 [Solemya velum]